MAFPCIFSERINTLRTILINSANLINQSTGKEKVVAQYMFATAFCNIIRNGTVYRREDGLDGTPRLVIMLGNTEYKCPEYLVEKLINKNFVITPYEDTCQHLDGLDILPKPDFIDTKLSILPYVLFAQQPVSQSGYFYNQLSESREEP